MARGNDRETPEGIYCLQVAQGSTKSMIGYAMVVENSGDFYNYFVTLAQYLPPVCGVDALIFEYDPPNTPSSFNSLGAFLEFATEKLSKAYPDQEVGHTATVESPTSWQLP